MTALQVSIGAVNDVVDAPRDAIGQPWKPIPAGLVRPSTARLLALVSAALGLAAVTPLGPAMLGLALLVLAIGLAYDLVLKGTRWSWSGFAIGIPILPVFAWYGATARLPEAFVILVPAGAIAGASLAIANSLVDLESDRLAGTASLAGAWGSRRSRLTSATLAAAVAVAAVVTAAARSAGPVAVGALAVAGIGAVAATRGLGSEDRRARQRAWQAQAVAVGLLAALWIGALALAGTLD